ncbi:uncharacterized protein LOC132272840 [Cornus florida]|uniref:uncharacterized protein LOC132272840 n=1 Tax=Cornus florida TaxID=4283 RepID=UPI00289B42B5|nr:uncharacterized protein LOC132272840 [Cornus florida]
MAINVDIMKAYDSVSWGFLLKILQGYGFSNYCFGFYKLSQRLNATVQNGNLELSHTAVKANVDISHTFFADDLLVTCKASIVNARVLSSIFANFGDISGLKISPHKSSIIFSKGVRRKRAVLQLWQCKEECLPLKYLGIPLCSTSIKKAHYVALIDKVKQKVTSWSANLLSITGKVELIRTVITPLCLYWCSVFQIPVTVLNQIQKVCRDFIGEVRRMGKRCIF